MEFEQFVQTGSFGLSEGSIYERLRRHPDVLFDPYIFHASLVYDAAFAQILKSVHREYLDVGQRHGVAMIALTDTWRANAERVRLSQFPDRPVNQDNVQLLRSVRSSYGKDRSPIFIGGHIGCAGGAYSPEQALSTSDAVPFHAPQLEALAAAGVDFLYAGTLPALSEALGMAQVMSELGLPYLFSFVIRGDGALLDGTPLAVAMERIDAANENPPAGYAVNCVHPSIFIDALSILEQQRPSMSRRILSFQANTSAREPKDLVGLAELDTERPELLADLMLQAHRQFGTLFLGGCCGTDTSHIEHLAQAYSNPA